MIIADYKSFIWTAHRKTKLHKQVKSGSHFYLYTISFNTISSSPSPITNTVHTTDLFSLIFTFNLSITQCYLQIKFSKLIPNIFNYFNISFLTILRRITHPLFWNNSLSVPHAYTLSNEIHSSEGHVLRDALWVYLLNC